jgi:hypothetical protein
MPRVDRVIMTLTANPQYTGFWPYVAEVWASKFKVKPTLMFYGDAQDVPDELPFAEVFHMERVPGVTVDQSLDWACTWSLFFGATLFPDEVCMLAGIDQVPLNGVILDKIKQAPAEHYTVGFGDAYYADPLRPDATFPSSHHVALGRKYKTVFGIEDDWVAEVTKVYGCRGRYPLPASYWGLDEAYSSEMLRSRTRSHGDVTFIKGFFQEFQSSRLWRGKDALQAIDLEGVRAGRYSEWHADRPFESNDPNALARLKESIPVYAW